LDKDYDRRAPNVKRLQVSTSKIRLGWNCFPTTYNIPKHSLRSKEFYKIGPGCQDILAVDQGTSAVVRDSSRLWILKPDGSYEWVTSFFGLLAISVEVSALRIRSLDLIISSLQTLQEYNSIMKIFRYFKEKIHKMFLCTSIKRKIDFKITTMSSTM